jgi:hypothetical protein
MTPKKEQKQHLIDIMKADEELGLYDETLEEAAENGWLNDNSMSSEHKEGFENGFKQGAKWQAERMYSEEDLKEAFKSCYTPFGFDRIGDLEQDFNKWFEQSKKK